MSDDDVRERARNEWASELDWPAFDGAKKAIVQGIEAADSDAQMAGSSRAAAWYQAESALNCLHHAGFVVVRGNRKVVSEE